MPEKAWATDELSVSVRKAITSDQNLLHPTREIELDSRHDRRCLLAKVNFLLSPLLMFSGRERGQKPWSAENMVWPTF